MAAFWEKMGVDLDTGPSIEQITEAFYRCDNWSRDDRKRLGYLAIYAGYIEGKKFSTATRASLTRLGMNLEKFENYPWERVAFKVLMDSLKVWAYYAMPELGANYGSPLPDGPSPLLLAYKGGQGRRRYFKSAINRHINVNNFVQKDLDEMFPEWDKDVEDPVTYNIIKVMFNGPGWKWTMDCWKVTGTHKVVKMEVSPVKNEVSSVKTKATTVKSESVVKEENSRPRKKARKGSSVSAEAPASGSDGFGMTKDQIERAFKDISDAISDGFGTCLREIKLLGDRMGAVEKMITKKGSSSDDIQLTTASNPPKPVHEPEVGTKTSPKIAEKRVTRQSCGWIFASESVNGAKAGHNEAKEHSVTTEPSSSTELCLVKPADDLPSDEPSVLILDKQVYTASDSLLEEARRQPKKETAMVNLREKSERERKLAPTQQTPFKGNITAKQIIPNKKVGRGYDPFAPYDKKKSKELTEWLEQDP
ncbi:uncharacterized protein LOC106413852 [Brassica napus]|uniref:uncharacterized protein LOC106413852 n=1 Tax=Brassica napus TaxID=3708 RepID=UPI0006AAAFB6|nr:uncharacterized protein LOC106413852 [Brassica napus]